MSSPAHLIAINVGNTRSHIGMFHEGRLERSERLGNGDLPAIVEQLSTMWSAANETDRAMLLASVNEPMAVKIISAVKDQLQAEIYRVGGEEADVPVPIGERLDPETMTGIDRLLNAAAAFDILKQACVIVDAGTAITVDFVDGEGTFHGGAIAPGASLQLKSLHQYTTALPDLAFHAPDSEAFGRNTAQAMYHGVFHGIRGMVQRLVEKYAESYGAFPIVVATGGDAPTIFDGEELIDRIVPELTLMGMEVAARHALADDSNPSPDVELG